MSDEAAQKERIEERFEPGRVGRLITRHLPECARNLEIEGVSVLGFRLTPGRECTGHFRLTFRDRQTGEETSQGVLLHLVDVAPRPRLSPKALAEYASLDLPIRTPEVAIPELNAILHPAALDPRLPALLEALDPAAMKPVLKPLLAQDGITLLGTRAKIISLTPGARATIRYRATVRDADGEHRLIGLIGKLNAHQRLAPRMAETLALWRETSGKFGQARPLGVIERMNLSLQTMIEGKRLNTTLQTAEFPDHLRQIAEALAAIHEAAIPLQRTRNPAREVKTIRARGRLLGQVSRDHNRVNRLVGALTEAVQARSSVETTIHADFHHANIMVDNAGIAVIDFDEMGEGDPALDAGRFPVSLSIPSLDVLGDLRLLDAGREHFLAHYLDLTGRDAGAVKLFEAVAFLASAATAWRLNRPGWEGHLEGFLDLSEKALAEATLRPSAQSQGRRTRIDRGRWVADPGYVALLVKPRVHRTHGAEVDTVSLRKEVRNGETLRLGWRLAGAGPDGRWRGNASGICRRGLRASHIMRTVDRLRDALDGELEGMAFPPILAAQGRLGLLIWEAETSEPVDFEKRSTRDDACRLAQALAALHRLPVPAEAQLLQKSRAPADEGSVISVRHPEPDHFGVIRGRILLRRPDKLCLARPLAAVRSLSDGIAKGADTTAARRFEDAYLEAANLDRSALDGAGASGQRQRT